MKRTIKGLGKQLRLNFDCYLFLAPFALIFIAFTVVPVVMSLVLSFTSYNVLEFPQFVGWKNYINLFLYDDIFLLAAKNTLVIAVIVGPVGYLMSLLLAWSINELNPKLRAVMVVLFYAPSISGAVYMIWTLLFSGDVYGYVNSLLMYLGVVTEPVQWLTDTRYMLAVVILVMVWMSLGAGFLSFVAGLQTVDVTLYECGYIEGIKSRWQELWFITLPAMRPQLMFGAVMSVTAAFSVGEVTTALCGFPSTDYAAHTILNHLTDYGTVRFEMGYACAIATILFVITVAINGAIQRMLEKIGK